MANRRIYSRPSFFPADLNGDGAVTASEISEYLSDPTDGLPYAARRLHSREQMRQVSGSDDSKVIVEYE